jgi:predicted  nucleic acid-binding Zn-ribbon protein
MLRNQREALSHVPMKKLKENLEYYDELIRKIEKSIKELEKEIKELSKKNYQEEYKLLKSIPSLSERFNKYCRELYERLVSKGKAKKLVLVAVAQWCIKKQKTI